MTQGSEEAAWQLVESYSPHIFRAVRASLPRAIRSKLDSQDFVQAVWATILIRRERLNQFEDPGQFIAYLAAVARNKVLDMDRHFLGTQGFDVRSEVPLSALDRRGRHPHRPTGLPLRAGHTETTQPPGKDPTPSQVAIAREAWHRAVHNCSSRDRQIVNLRIAGHAYGAIADRLAICEKTVRRSIHRMLDEMRQ